MLRLYCERYLLIQHDHRDRNTNELQVPPNSIVRQRNLSLTNALRVLRRAASVAQAMARLRMTSSKPE